MQRWKVEESDLELYRRRYDFSKARDRIFEYTDTDYAPWHIVHMDDERRGTLNALHHIIAQFPYQAVERTYPKMPSRPESPFVRRLRLDRHPSHGCGEILSRSTLRTDRGATLPVRRTSHLCPSVFTLTPHTRCLGAVSLPCTYESHPVNATSRPVASILQRKSCGPNTLQTPASADR